MPRWTLAVRSAIGLIGTLLLAGGLAALGIGQPLAGAWAVIGGAVLIVGAVFEAGRYAASDEGQLGADRFERTEETFEDPTSGERVRVWFDPESGSRRYEPDP